MPGRLRADRRRGDQHRGRRPARPRGEPPAGGPSHRRAPGRGGGHRGGRVWARGISTASSDEKLERLKGLGLDHGINYATDSFVERTRELTDSRGVNVALDSIGGQNLVDSIGVLAYRGTLVSVGLAARAGSAVEAQSLWAQNNALRGVYLGGAILAEYPRIHAMISDLLG